MKGYFNKPTATAEAIDEEGWFHTGDIGVAPHDGFLAITDRKKDIIVTAGGKKIAPQPIENRVKTSGFVSQAVMIGDKRKFPVVLVVPNWDSLEKWARDSSVTSSFRDVDRKQLLATSDDSAPKWNRKSRRRLTGLAHFEAPKKIGLLEHDFSIERGELTPTLKVKQYASWIDRTYKDADRFAV